VALVNAKGGPRGPGGRGDDGDDHSGDGQGGKTIGASGDKLKACMKAKGIDPSKTPTDEAAKKAKDKALRECIKSTKA
jgi:hypothetical protein